ncbi:testis-specific chromodomain protein y 1 [Fusarium sporotrichioides]|uniref:Testis-specific chromodomain protein y 1 n=1 Tax=Fusarium sporotrichioides TaxID=5514 RepID=A0A395REE3_FUSSP|nr:testis-specific chromodomain protein y 1 [Fusarium sporotrichioides]
MLVTAVSHTGSAFALQSGARAKSSLRSGLDAHRDLDLVDLRMQPAPEKRSVSRDEESGEEDARKKAQTSPTRQRRSAADEAPMPRSSKRVVSTTDETTTPRRSAADEAPVPCRSKHVVLKTAVKKGPGRPASGMQRKGEEVLRSKRDRGRPTTKRQVTSPDSDTEGEVEEIVEPAVLPRQCWTYPDNAGHNPTTLDNESLGHEYHVFTTPRSSLKRMTSRTGLATKSSPRPSPPGQSLPKLQPPNSPATVGSRACLSTDAVPIFPIFSRAWPVQNLATATADLVAAVPLRLKTKGNSSRLHRTPSLLILTQSIGTEQDEMKVRVNTLEILLLMEIEDLGLKDYDASRAACRNGDVCSFRPNDVPYRVSPKVPVTFGGSMVDAANGLTEECAVK